jgi:guanosine-3',5'-bis(diphosphate) 3'-pyrophosphohydrolase
VGEAHDVTGPEDRWRKLLRLATVALEVPTGRKPAQGTGFFVGPGLVATCAHVVAGRPDDLPEEVFGVTATGERIRLRTSREAYFRDDHGLDLAFLRAPGDADLADLPYALLSPQVEVGEALWTYGHPRGRFHGGQSASFRCEGISRLDRHDGTELLRLRGTPVGPGFSGSAVANRGTGTVCGMLCTSDQAGSAHVLPAGEIIARSGVVRMQIAAAEVSYRRWFDVLTDEELRAGGWTVPGPQLRRYLRAAARAARQHPYPGVVPGVVPPPLSSVYVQQHARTEHTGPAVRTVPAETVFDSDVNGVLVGAAGAGKSSLLRAAVSTLTERWARGTGTAVPVRVLAADLVAPRPLPEAIAASVNADLGVLGAMESWPPEFFRRPPVPGAAWLLLIDALDEVIDPRQRQAIMAKLAGVGAEEGPVYRFVVATRPSADIDLGAASTWHAVRYDLLPFSDRQFDDFAERWFSSLELPAPSVAARNLASQLRGTGLEELSRNPLMATMLCQLFAAQADGRLPIGRTRVYRAFVDLLRRRLDDPEHGVYQQIRAFGPAATKAIDDLLARSDELVGRLAHARQQNVTIPALRLLTEWTAGLRPAQLPEADWTALLAEVLRRTGVLVERSGDFVFLHQTIAEFLAARFTALDQQLSDELFRTIFRSGFWRSTTPLPAWRQSYFRFLVAAWQDRPDLDAALRRVATKAGLDGAAFVAALVADGVPVEPGIAGQAFDHLASIAENDVAPGPDRRHLAVAAAIQLDDARGCDLLIGIAGTPGRGRAYRRWAVSGLAEFGLAAESGRAVLIGEETALDSRALSAIARLEHPAACDLLVQLTTDGTFQDPERRWAGEALAKRGDRRGTDLLAELAGNPAAGIAARRWAANALAEVDDSRGVGFLVDITRDSSVTVADRRQAAQTLSALPGTTGLWWRARLARFNAPWQAPQISEVLEPLAVTHRLSHPKADLRPLQKAYDAAARWHEGQYRKSGDPYITHPLAVATILAELGMDTTTLAAALLHDTIENSEYPLDQMRADFGGEIALLVDGVTRLDRVTFGDAAAAETIRKLVVAAAKDPRVLVMELACRLHNMRTLTFLPQANQEATARETVEILAPLAHRLGINTIKWELEDLAFKTLFPKRFDEIDRLISEYAPQRDALLHHVAKKVVADLRGSKIKAEVTGRPTHLYSIYQRMISRNREFAEIYDVLSVRILVDTVRDCYAALGVIHAHWQPVPGRIKDYIAMPKLNMYQSLHTTVIGPNGKPVEMQIRTFAMHRTAEYGIAAHWRYRDVKGATVTGPVDVEQPAWLRQLLDWQREATDPSEFLDALRFDLSSEEIYVSTPKGDVISLPTGATPVDFAYAVHAEVGHTCVGARVNGKLVPLESALSNGDVVEIFTSRSKTAGPTQDWLGFVKTPRAQTKIRQFFSKERREEAIEAGKEAITKAMRKQGLPMRMLTAETLMTIARELHLADVASLYTAVGGSQVSAHDVVSLLVAAYGGQEGAVEDIADATVATRPPRTRGGPYDPGVAIEGVEDVRIKDVWIKLARCCTPVPPDAIFGFVTRTGAVSVHRDDCVNAADLRLQPERIVATTWKPTITSVFLVGVQVEALDRHSLLADVTKALSDQRVNVLSATVATTRDRVAVSRFRFEMADPKHLGHLLATLRKIDGVYDAYRVTSSD